MYPLQTTRFQLIQVVVNTQQANQDYAFQQQPLLQSVTGGQRVFVEAMEFYPSNGLAASPLSPTLAAATPADTANTVMTLSVLGTDRIKNMPLARMNPIWSNDTNYSPFVMYPFLLVNMWGIDWTQSKITTVVAAHAAAVTFSFGIHFCYSTDPQGQRLLRMFPDEQ
jgi:hypothetical protein